MGLSISLGVSKYIKKNLIALQGLKKLMPKTFLLPLNPHNNLIFFSNPNPNGVNCTRNVSFSHTKYENLWTSFWAFIQPIYQALILIMLLVLANESNCNGHCKKMDMLLARWWHGHVFPPIVQPLPLRLPCHHGGHP